MLQDLGILLEIIGFALLIFNKGASGGTALIQTHSGRKISSKWKYLQFSINGNKGEALKYFSVVMIFLGLIMQMSTFNQT